MPLRRLRNPGITHRSAITADEMGLSSSKSDRVFKPAKAKGGCELDTSKTALVLIEYQF